YLLAGLFLLAAHWAAECKLLRHPVVTLGLIRVHKRRPLGNRWLSYHFRDLRGEYQGGTTLDFGGPEKDQIKLVFYDPLSPGINKVSSGLFFHRVEWRIGREGAVL